MSSFEVALNEVAGFVVAVTPQSFLLLPDVGAVETVEDVTVFPELGDVTLVLTTSLQRRDVFSLGLLVEHLRDLLRRLKA